MHTYAQLAIMGFSIRAGKKMGYCICVFGRSKGKQLIVSSMEVEKAPKKGPTKKLSEADALCYVLPTNCACSLQTVMEQSTLIRGGSDCEEQQIRAEDYQHTLPCTFDTSKSVGSHRHNTLGAITPPHRCREV